MVTLLLRYGAYPNIQDTQRGTTALMAAAGVSQKNVEMLIQYNADPIIKNADGTTAFTHCITGILSGRVTTDMAKLFLELGADIDEAPEYGPAEGFTSLMMAVWNNAPDLVRFPVEHGADVNTRSKDGATPLKLAKEENNASMVALLKEPGAK